ncbi:MAG: rRNA maturation RNase YbeY [Mariprofundales bacterium]
MIEVLIDYELQDYEIITADRIRESCLAACHAAKWPEEIGLCVRISDNDSIKSLNTQWRDKNSITDVLSFPTSNEPDKNSVDDLGDIILAWPFTITEANRLELSANAHACHLIIHGTLHLFGYNHIDDDDAMQMQSCENIAMQELGLHLIS